MIKLIIGKTSDLFIIGEYNTETNMVSNCFQLVTIYLNNVFHHSIKPLVLPFCLSKPVNLNIDNISYWVEVDLAIFSNLITEYIKIKDELNNPKKDIPSIQIH